jgi:hypothetical protein
MSQGKIRVSVDHARAGVTHHLFDLRPHRRLVAVDRALGTRGLVGAERAAVQPAKGLAEQFLALAAERTGRPVMGPTVNPGHGPDGTLLPRDSRGILGHSAASPLF